MAAYDTKTKSGEELRSLVRSGYFGGQTAGQAPDYLQGNVVILPRQDAAEFLQFCLNNPKPCPLIGLSAPGEISIPALAENLDIRSDIPRYRIYRDGNLASEVSDITTLWSDDLVTFVLGCSFTFEEAILREGFTVRHIEQRRNVPMYRTTLQTIPAGKFSGPVVVTMRPFAQNEISAIYDICARYPHAHGAPLAWGDPQQLGIDNLQKPDYGDPVDLRAGDVPVFWACGVTPQAAIEASKPALCITHAPGHMLVTDIHSTSIPIVDISLAQFID